MEKGRLLMEAQKKEKDMPDIKTAFEQALAKAQPRAQLPADWDDEGGEAAIESITTKAKEATMPRQFFTTTNNVTRTTFDYIAKHPGKTRKEILNALAAQGYKQGSTSSLIGQFTKQGHIVNRDGFLFAQQAEYKPLKTSQRKAAVVVPPKAAPKAAPKAKPEVKPEAAPQVNTFDLVWNAENLLNSLSIKQARALYDELRKIFGG
jgi:hypothetical protein